MARIRGKRAESVATHGSPGNPTPVKITKVPLNDDAEEKAKRLEKRTAMQDLQKQKMKAAASPGRRTTLSGNKTNENIPNTPRNVGTTPGSGRRRDTSVLDAVTPMRKVPLLSNFEEWLKLASDNKITAENSWNFALIDYFYDMTLLREGDGVNFQKASHTLDGCVKIYTSRVDSVATETGKLLSQLADSNFILHGRRDDGDDEENSDAEGGDGEGKKTRKMARKSSEATLAKDFDHIKVKKLELEFSVDPLFKKASADFDEGGAKGLLLNHLSIDNTGRIVFDSSDDKVEKGKYDEEVDENGNIVETGQSLPVIEGERELGPAVLQKLEGLQKAFLPNLDVLDEQDICPSLKNFDIGEMDAAGEIPFLKALEERGEFGVGVNGACANGAGTDGMDDDVMQRDDMAFGFDDGFGIGGDDDDDDMVLGFGEGGEAWANMNLANAGEHMLSPGKRPMVKGDIDPDSSMNVGYMEQENILSYFDEALKRNWAGPEHWRIRRLKDNTKPIPVVPRERKEKEVFTIDFMDPTTDPSEELFKEPKTTSTIALAKKDRDSKTRHLLPDDKHFNSRQLLKLFTKPKASLSKRRKMGENVKDEPENLDEEFWAKETLARELQASSTPDRPSGLNYDANFFNDDNINMPVGGDDHDDDDVFADAQEGFSPNMDPVVVEDNVPPPSTNQTLPPNTIAGPFGSQLVTQARRMRPEYVQYARVAKKVDVRKLKTNIWSGLGFESVSQPEAQLTPDGDEPAKEPPSPPMLVNPEVPRMFTQIIKNLRDVYPEKSMADISTSYCFICLLHLANEKGLKIDEVDDKLHELSIVKDLTATITSDD